MLRTALNSAQKESESPGEKRRSEKGSWVRTGESGVGLSEGRKGGLLHGQLVELGQLLGVGGTRELRRLLSSSTSHTKLKMAVTELCTEVQRGHADTWQTLQQDARTWPGGNQWAWLPTAKNLNELCLSLTS